MSTCHICENTDEMCSHTAPGVTADGRGYTIALGPPSVRLTTAEEVLRDALRDAMERIEALEIMVLDLRSRERLSREP
jgi:hypothetical protein